MYPHLIEGILLSHGSLEHPYADGIVKVLGVIGVDGESHHLAAVLAPAYLLRGDTRFYAVSRLLHRLGIGIRQPELGQDSMHLSGVLARLPQDVHDLSHGVLAVAGPLDDFHYRLVARLALLQFPHGNEDIVGQRAVLGKQVGIVLAHLQGAHIGPVGTLHDFHHLSLTHVVAATGHHGCLHHIPVHGFHRVALSHEEGFAAIRRHKGILSVGLPAEHALHDLRRRIEVVVVLGLFHDKIVEQQFVQHVHAQNLGRMRIEVQDAVDILQGHHFRSLTLK